MEPEPTPALIATARRAAGRSWTVGPEGPIELDTNPDLAVLVAADLVMFRYTPAYQRADDYWRLTLAGEQWYMEHYHSHVTTLVGPDSVGHWAWECTRPDCTGEASGYEPDEIVAAAQIHGPLAADTPLPKEDPDDL